MAVNDSSEIRTAGTSISTREAGGGGCNRWALAAGEPRLYPLRTHGRIWEMGCRCPCFTGRPAAPDLVPDLLSCPQVSVGGAWGVLTGSVEKTKTTFRRKPHVSPTLKTVLVIENAEKVLGRHQPGRPLASNDPVPSTLPSPKPGRFSRPAAAGQTTTITH